MRKLLGRYDIFVAIALFFGALVAERSEMFSLVEDQTLSFRQILRNGSGDTAANALDPGIVLVNTDEAFFKAYGTFPLRRTDIGKIVTNLKSLGAKTIAIDVLMDFPSSYGEDPALAAILKDAGNTLLVAQADFRGGVFQRINGPTRLLDESSPSAYTNINSASRLVTTLSRLKIYPELIDRPAGWPFAVKAAALALGVEPRLEGTTLVLGDRRIGLDRAHHLYIDFPPLPAGTRFLSESAGLSALEFLDLSDKDESEIAELAYWVKDKIVIIGDTSEVSHDRFDTPVGMVYGVEIIADSVSTILKGGRLTPLSDTAEAAVALVMLAGVIAIALLSNQVLRLLAVVALGGGFVAAATLAHVQAGVVVSMSYVALATFLSQLMIEYYHFALIRNQKRQISKVFGQYIPAELVEEMNRSGKGVEVGGESRELTVLFSDVRSFTTISEGLAPQELTRLMNEYLSPMTRVIHKHRGTIDKYMGDAIMAFWGAPLEDRDHATHALRAALAMIDALDQVNVDFAARGWKPIKIGIGLNTGIMNVGNMGSDFRLAYTVLGDAVNLGSRLEGLTKEYGVILIVSEFTYHAVPGIVARELDMVRVKGKDKPVVIYEPVGFKDEVDPAVIATIARHQEGIALYRRQKWAEARAVFSALQAADPERKIYSIYLKRIAHFEAAPPGADWDGVFTFTTK